MEAGNVIDGRLVQFQNAKTPMLTKDSGIYYRG